MTLLAEKTPPTRQTKRGPRLKLLDRDNVNSQLGPDDFDIPDYSPDVNICNRKYDNVGHDAAVIRMMADRVMSDSQYRRIKEPTWYESLAWYIGLQTYRWNYNSWSLRSMRTPANMHKSFAVRNKIKPKVKKLVFQSFSQKPDAAVKASTDSDLDRRATAEARDLLSHLDHKFARDYQTRKLGLWALVTSTVALKIGWDNYASAEMPKFGENGEVVGSEIWSGNQAPGDVSECEVPIFELLLDSQARTYSQLSRVIHQKVYPLAYIRQQWPNGKFVRPDAGLGIAGYVENRLAAATGEYPRGNEPGPVKNNCATVFECYETPTDIYPHGRFIVCSQSVLLDYEEEWPNMDAQALLAQGIRVPFAFMSYEESMGSLYGLNVVTDMIPPQRTINATVSREEEHLATAWGKLLCQEGSKVTATAFDDARPNEKIWYARGAEVPEHLEPPALPAWIPALKEQAEADLDDISGLHEVSDADVPGGVESGVAIGKLQRSDANQGSMFAANIEEYHRQRAIIEIHVAGRNYLEPRLLFVSKGYFGDPSQKMTVPGVQPSAPPPMPPPAAPVAQGMGDPDDDQGQPAPPQQPTPAPPFTQDTDTAAMDVRAFTALNKGGSCHVEITPGSALAKDPDAERAEILKLAELGVLGPVGDPTTAGIVLELMDYAGSDEIVEAMQRAESKRMAFQLATAPNPQSVQALKNESAQQVAQLKIAQETAIEQAKQQHEGAILALKSQLDAQKIQMETQAELQVKQQQTQSDAMAAQQEQYFTLHQALLDKLHPDLKLNMTADPIATAGFEAALGLPTPDPAVLHQQMAAEAATATAGAQTAQTASQVAGASAPHQVAQTAAGAQSAQAQAQVDNATVPSQTDAADADAQTAQAGAQSAQFAADNPEGED